VAEDGRDDKVIATISQTVEIEQSVEETLPIGGGSTLVRRQENYTVNVQGVTAEMADHQLAMLKHQCESNERIAKIEAEGRVAVAENQYVAPVKALMGPVKLMAGILGAGGFVALFLGSIPVASICFGGLVIGGIVKSVADSLKKPPEKS
jgi:hypothetical protein